MERERKKLAGFEDDLAREEKALEVIRDSLKGSVLFSDINMITSTDFNPRPPSTTTSDKTQVYHDQIEVKQRELQPWTAKINKKQAELDVAKSERDMLAKKAEAAKAALDEAKSSLEQLQEDQKAKVGSFLREWCFETCD